MKKILLLVLVLALALTGFIIFGTGGGDKIEKIIPPDLSNTIFIGVYEPTTGASASGGKQELLGIRYANSVFPSVQVDGETYEIKLIEADNMSDITEAEGVALQLAESGVAAVIGSYGSSLSLAGAQVFDDAGLAVVGASCTNPAITAEHTNYFRVCYLDSFQGTAMANYAYNQGCRTAAVSTMVGDAYSKDLGGFFRDEFVRLGGTVSEHSFNIGQRNFEDLIGEIKNSKADVVFMPSLPEIAGFFIKQAREEKLLLPIMGGDTWDNAALISELGSAGSDVFFSSAFDPKATAGTAAAEFTKNFGSWLNEDKQRLEENGGSDLVSSISALGYDAYVALIKALESAPGKSPKDVLEALPSLSFEGATGLIEFDKNGDGSEKTAYIKTINTKAAEFELVQVSSSAG